MDEIDRFKLVRNKGPRSSSSPASVVVGDGRASLRRTAVTEAVPVQDSNKRSLREQQQKEKASVLRGSLDSQPKPPRQATALPAPLSPSLARSSLDSHPKSPRLAAKTNDRGLLRSSAAATVSPSSAKSPTTLPTKSPSLPPATAPVAAPSLTVSETFDEWNEEQPTADLSVLGSDDEASAGTTTQMMNEIDVASARISALLHSPPPKKRLPTAPVNK